MSASGDAAAVLSREELSALLEGAPAEARPLHELGGDLRRGELADIGIRFAEEQARGLSTLYQTPIHFEFAAVEDITLRQFASAMLPTDRVARIEIGEGRHAYLLLSRPLAFAWLMLAFGARGDRCSAAIPARPYTRIELRFLGRAADVIARTLGKALGLGSPPPGELTLEDPTALYDRSKKPHRVLRFDVRGLGEPSSLRIALPAQVVGETVAERPQHSEAATAVVTDQLLATPVRLQVRLGSAQLGLRELAELAVGDELPLVAEAGEGRLRVDVEGVPRFHAEVGKLGKRLAVRITDIIEA